MNYIIGITLLLMAAAVVIGFASIFVTQLKDAAPNSAQTPKSAGDQPESKTVRKSRKRRTHKAK
jgi:hypothetical protein